MHFGPIVRALLHNPTRFWLITAEVALTLAIVVNCVTIIGEQRELLTRPSGLDEANLVVVTTQPFADDFTDDAFLENVREQDLEKLRSLPGVRAAAAIDYVPMGGSGSMTQLRPDGDDDSEGVATPYFTVGLGALDTLGVELVAGREHVESDLRPGLEDPGNVLVTQALADKLYPGEDAVGKALHDIDTGELFGTIIGIVKQMHNAWPRSRFVEQVMLLPGPPDDQRMLRYIIRTEADAMDHVFASLEPAVSGVNDGRIVRVRLLDGYKRHYFEDELVLVKVLTSLAILLVVVTSLGIIGLTSFSVTQRTREIGTRRALGATRIEVLRYFVIEIWVITGIGLVAGVFLAYALNYALAHLAGAPALPWTLLAGGVALLWTIGVAAALAPAFQATLVPPVVTTRTV